MSVSICGVEVDKFTGAKLFVSGSCDTTAKLFDIREKNHALCSYEGHKADVNSTHFLGEQQAFLTGSDDGTVNLWDLRSQSCIAKYSQEENSSCIVDVTASGTGRFILASLDDKICVAWDTLTGEKVQTLVGHEKRISSLSVSPNGSALCTASWDRTLRIWS